MKIGLLLPQGYFNEFEGWTATAAWDRVLEVARLGERLGFDSLWTGEHVLAKWDPEGFAFDCVTLHTAVAAAIPRVWRFAKLDGRRSRFWFLQCTPAPFGPLNSIGLPLLSPAWGSRPRARNGWRSCSR